jgi:hypothetical protein
MIINRKEFLETFDNFLTSFDNKEYGKVSFKLQNGKQYQGWISSIDETTFTYLDSGPLAKAEPHIINIDDIDISSFAYWDDEIKKWTKYLSPDKKANRKS